MENKEIEQRAESLVASLGILEPPVSPMWIASKLDYVLQRVDFRSPAIHGSVMAKANTVYISFSRDDSPNRQRFTVAHEIGHARLHLLQESDAKYEESFGFIDTDRTLTRGFADTDKMLYRLNEIEPGSANEKEEHEANKFAAALLMPGKMIRVFWGATKNTLDLALIFKVSEQAMVFRLKNLGLR